MVLVHDKYFIAAFLLETNGIYWESSYRTVGVWPSFPVKEKVFYL